MTNTDSDDFLLIQAIKQQKEIQQRSNEEMLLWKFGQGLIPQKKDDGDDLSS